MALALPHGRKWIPINLGGQFASFGANVAAIKYFCYYICLATTFLHYCFLVMKQASVTNFGSLVAPLFLQKSSIYCGKKGCDMGFFPPLFRLDFQVLFFQAVVFCLRKPFRFHVAKQVDQPHMSLCVSVRSFM
jgi:hypothetical protein